MKVADSRRPPAPPRPPRTAPPAPSDAAAPLAGPLQVQETQQRKSRSCLEIKGQVLWPVANRDIETAAPPLDEQSTHHSPRPPPIHSASDFLKDLLSPCYRPGPGPGKPRYSQPCIALNTWEGVSPPGSRKEIVSLSLLKYRKNLGPSGVRKFPLFHVLKGLRKTLRKKENGPARSHLG